MLFIEVEADFLENRLGVGHARPDERLAGQRVVQVPRRLEPGVPIPFAVRIDHERISIGKSFHCMGEGIRHEDIAGPYEPQIPSDLVEQAKLKTLAYRTPLEARIAKYETETKPEEQA